MKKFLLFISLFLILLMGLQIVSGILLTLQYTPDIAGSYEGGASGGMLLGDRNLITILIPIAAASIAYFLAGKIGAEKAA
ncbi:hypothetical protein MM300_12765 [Evansella sp. LMS18]|jgi:quinol-cytochrome oxidoreductase complex cytochrome b subunit|uniref:hypothetical protein n=1 Tax=Evansella sp. LMS18 TaxID=2924033 RepID=UPI0020D1D13B|nr:hypothetical protein [Evansella sp. LMS18]UTR08809.1 hypothetical protein MM300_12765 [Evansella sp. LMS18]